MNTLVEIPRSEWPKLRNLYKAKQMLASSYQTIQNFIEWTSKEPQLFVKIFSLNGDWEDDGTFLIRTQSNLPQIFINTLSDNLDRLTTALNCLKIDGAYFIFGAPERLLPAIEKHYLHSGLDKSDFNVDCTVWYHKPKEEALKFEIDPPEGITLRSLKLENAEQVNNNWPHRTPGSIVFVERMIKHNLNVGAFDRDGNLISWCLRYPTGSLALLTVMDSYKRRGFGNLMVRYMAKHIAELGFDTMASVIVNNTPSLKMFEMLGFKPIDRVYWFIKPDKTQQENHNCHPLKSKI